jgi:membrane protease subunit HflK
MPWSNQSGGSGGGGWKGGSGGPWGQPPGGGGSNGGGGNRPPDLEELLRRSQDRLRSVLPGGGGRGGSSNALVGGAIVVGLIGIWLYNSIYFVQPQEIGVELRFGEVKPELNGPGPHFHWWPIESVELPPVLQENQENIGFTGARQTTGETALMLSGDQNLVEVGFSVLWRIEDPVAYLFNVADQQDVVRMVAESAMREYVGRTNADEFRTEGLNAAQEAVQALTQGTLNNYSSGIAVTAINIVAANPPQDVADAFEEVQRAQQDQIRFQQEAQAYANERLGDARGEAAQVGETALGYRDQVIANATGEAQRFRSVYEEYVQAPDVTRQRLYLEALSDVLANSDKVILDEEGAGVVPYLPLPEVNRRSQEVR